MILSNLSVYASPAARYPCGAVLYLYRPKNLLGQNLLKQKIVMTKYFFGPKYFGLKLFLNQICFCTKNFLRQKNILDQKYFGTKIIFDLDQKNVGTKILWITYTNFIIPRKSLHTIFSLIPNCFERNQTLFEPKNYWEPTLTFLNQELFLNQKK